MLAIFEGSRTKNNYCLLVIIHDYIDNNLVVCRISDIWPTH